MPSLKFPTIPSERGSLPIDDIELKSRIDGILNRAPVSPVRLNPDLPLELAGLGRLLGCGVGVATGPRLPGAVGVLHVSPPFGGGGGYRWMAR